MISEISGVSRFDSDPAGMSAANCKRRSEFSSESLSATLASSTARASFAASSCGSAVCNCCSCRRLSRSGFNAGTLACNPSYAVRAECACSSTWTSRATSTNKRRKSTKIKTSGRESPRAMPRPCLRLTVVAPRWVRPSRFKLFRRVVRNMRSPLIEGDPPRGITDPIAMLCPRSYKQVATLPKRHAMAETNEDAVGWRLAI